jgi:hypothetical protein
MRAGGRAALRLSLPLAIGLLTACGQQPAPAKPAVAERNPQGEIDEVHALVAGIKEHPSLVNAAKDAGPAIHVDPFPKMGGTASHPHAAK